MAELGEEGWYGTRRIAALHTWTLLEAARRGGIEPEQLLRDAGADAPPAAEVTAFIPLSLHEALYEAAVLRTGDPLFSLRMGEAATGERFDLYAYALRTVETMWDAACLGAELHRRTSPHLWFGVERRRSSWCWSIATSSTTRPGWPEREIEYLLSMAVTAMEEIVGRRVPLLEVRFSHAAAGPVGVYERRFRSPVRFSCTRSELVMPLEIAHWPSIQGDPGLSKLLQRELRGALEAIAGGERASTRVREVMENELGGELNESLVASALGMPVRTLQHRLRREGTSYSALLDSVRRTRAVNLVAESDASIAEISAALGYGDVRSFHRAFRRWTGASPTAHRRRGAAST